MDLRRTTFAEYDERAQVTCERCGWDGCGLDAVNRPRSQLVELRCPSCDATLAVVGFPDWDVTVAQSTPGVPGGRCPWCGASGRTPLDDEWWCMTCHREFPTMAHKCHEPTCWEYVFLDDYCARHRERRSTVIPPGYADFLSVNRDRPR